MRVVEPPMLDSHVQQMIEEKRCWLHDHPDAFDGEVTLVLRASPQVIEVYHATYAWSLVHHELRSHGTSPLGLGGLGTGLLLCDEEGHYLWSRRSDHVMHSAGQWDVSASGMLDAGEDPKEGVVREAVEELGLSASDIKDLHARYAFIGNVNNACSLIFYGKIARQTPLTLSDYEISETKWSKTPVGRTALIDLLWETMSEDACR
jgi:8-oxo-dGTP pyrophosphatase MutT (NUDIX family)